MDTDETDARPHGGADLDLHFLHPLASTWYDADGDGQPDPYFDPHYDCFWFNLHPQWGKDHDTTEDDPRLEGDDDGALGHETVVLNVPEPGLTYGVAVHGWEFPNRRGPDYSLATVRIYAGSILVFQAAGVPLREHDLWKVATIAWPSGTVTPITDAAGGNVIVPNYEHPLFLSN